MTKTLIVFALLLSYLFIGQNRKEYLTQNRYNLLDTNFTFPQTKFKIIGFGAYHGSSQTEKAEIILIKDLLNQGSIKYYLPETDFSTAKYFNKFLKTGDTILLKDLVIQYGTRVPQEQTIEVFVKWKHLKELNDQLSESKRIIVVGTDKILNFKYTAINILELLKDSRENIFIKKLSNTITNNYTSNLDAEVKKHLISLATDFKKNPTFYNFNSKDSIELNHIIRNIFTANDPKSSREKIIFENYISLSKIYDFQMNPQFVRMGFFHLEKSREGKNNQPSFFTQLKENNIYSESEIISVLGFLTKSRVLWTAHYDRGIYLGYATEGGYGIGDYWKEYFKGISALKKTSVSNLTLFKLNSEESPYNKKPDLIKVNMFLKKSNRNEVRYMNTLDFMDYALLISNSEASIPIFEKK